jgi:hypothetical protein
MSRASTLAKAIGSGGITNVADSAVTYPKLSSDVQNDMNMFKNRIINGAMMIDQRYSGGTIGAITGSAYTVDRFGIIRVGGTSTLTPQQSTVAPEGFINSLIVTAGSGATPSGTEERSLFHRIEGLNCTDLGWGTATAKTVTLSFWVRSSLTGTFGVSLTNSAFNRSYVAAYTINAANTWEQKTITIAGDISGTWLTSNGIGISIYWDLGVGTTYSGSATGAWQGAGYEGLTGGTKLSATSSATFYITGVQLEKGSTATSFDYRPYGTELQLCQRYYYTFGGDSANNLPGNGQCYSTTAFNNLCVAFPATMRANPTLSYSSLSDWYVQNASGGGLTPLSISQSSNDTSTKSAALRGTVSSGLVAGNATGLYAANTNARLNFNSEL